MNYYNYFTEAEDHFRQARNSGMFLFSPLDWALLEAWKDAGVPLEAVLRGIDRAFAKYHSRKRRYSQVNSLAYCAQEVLGAARESARVAAMSVPVPEPSFPPAELASFLQARARELRGLAAGGSAASAVFNQTATTLEELAAQAGAEDLADLEAVEQRLAVLEDRVHAVAMSALSEEQLLAMRQEFDRQLRAYRRKMTAEQLATLEQRFLRRRCLEELGLSRLSLFYAF